MAAEIKLSKVEYVFREGETASYAYMLKEGSVSIVKSGVDGLVKLNDEQAGIIFCEMARQLIIQPVTVQKKKLANLIVT